MRHWVILAVATLLLASAPSAQACSCIAMTPREKARSADVVFTGPVRELHQRHDGIVVARFQVRTLYKGSVRRMVNIETGPDEAACGCSFKQGRRYTVFAYRLGAGEGLATDICSGTKPGTIEPDRYGFPSGSAPS
jgi:hypothetical protein